MTIKSPTGRGAHRVSVGRPAGLKPRSPQEEPQESKKSAQPRGMGFLLTVLALVGSLHALVMLGVETNRWLYSRGEITRLERDLSDINGEIEVLNATVNHRYDASYRESLARLQGFVYPDEVRYVTVTERQ